jgi:hypothetical protein
MVERVNGADGSLHDSDITGPASVIMRSSPATAWQPGWKGTALPEGADGNHPIAASNKTLVKTWLCRRFGE